MKDDPVVDGSVRGHDDVVCEDDVSIVGRDFRRLSVLDLVGVGEGEELSAVANDRPCEAVEIFQGVKLRLARESKSWSCVP